MNDTTAPKSPATNVRRHPVTDDRVILVKLFGNDRALMRNLAQRIGQMGLRHKPFYLAKEKAIADRGAIRAAGEQPVERKGKEDVVVDVGGNRHPFDNVPNISIGTGVRALIAAGYIPLEIFAQDEDEERHDRQSGRMIKVTKHVIQLTLRHPSAPKTQPGRSFATETSPAKESVDEMLPRFLEVVDPLVFTSLHVYDNVARDGNPGTVTVNAAGVTSLKMLNNLTFESGDLVVTKLPKAAKLAPDTTDAQ